MKNFMWILKHYFKKNFFVLANYILIGLPLIFIVAFGFFTDFIGGLDGANDPAFQAGFVAMFGGLTTTIVLGFQFFGADTVSSWLHEDLKGPTGSRLRVSGISERYFYLGVIVAGWLFNILVGGVLIVITEFVPFINADWGNYIFAVIAIALTALVVQLIGVLIFYLSKDKKAAGKIGYVFGEIMIGVAMIPVLGNAFNLPAVVERIFDFFPAGLGLAAIRSNSFIGALPYFGILLAVIVVMAGIVVVVGRRKGHDSI
jgi:hypothetical protein